MRSPCLLPGRAYTPVRGAAVTTLTVTVPGVPQPQGSMRHFGPGRPMESSNKATLLPWRASVVAHVRQAMEHGGEWPITGPVKVAVSFTLPRPKSAPRWRLWPDKKPDLDKLCRAAFDALSEKTGAGAIHDDAQIVLLSADKSYGTPQMSLLLRSLECPRSTP